MGVAGADVAGETRIEFHFTGVTPAKAGVPLWVSMRGRESWIPAFAGMTEVWG